MLNNFKIIKRINFYNKLLSSRFLWNNSINPELETDYFFNDAYFNEIDKNIKDRKGIGDIRLVKKLKNDLDKINPISNEYKKIQNHLQVELLKLPNKSHPDIKTYNNEPQIIKTIGVKRQFSKKPLKFNEITKKLKILRTDHLGNLCGNKSYFILGELAELEYALIKYVTSKLFENNFKLISVPDILPRHIIEGCGMNTRGQRNQVYCLDSHLHESNLCLSGTSEIALAGYLGNKILNIDDLPIKLAAVSRCYRAETSNLYEERGIYRVHEFTKVEMFVATTPNQSDNMLNEIRKIQEDIFETLNFHFNVLDMPSHELGAQAYRKYDLEAWMCGREIYGEISSCSNCTDYQSRRLGIKYLRNDEKIDFVHTLNGTACAIPRSLMALVEGEQQTNGRITIPKCLQKFMNNKEHFTKQKFLPELKLIKNIV